MNLEEVDLDGDGDEYRAEQNQTVSNDENNDELPSIQTEPMGLRLVPSFDQIKVKTELDSKAHKASMSPAKIQGKRPEQRVADVRISDSAMKNNQKRDKSMRDLEELDVVDIREDDQKQGPAKHS